jgi:hypothetical protein
MAGQGVAPLDPTTAVGQARTLVDDTAYVPLEPPVDGEGVYEYFSDAELTAYLNLSSNSPYRAAGNATLRLAREAALLASSIATDDLKGDTTHRAADLRAIAAEYFSIADDQDARDAESGFDLGRSGYRRPYPGLRFPLNPEYVPVGSWPPEGF